MAFGYDYLMPMYMCPRCSYMIEGQYLHQSPDMGNYLQDTERSQEDENDMYRRRPFFPPRPAFRSPLLPLILAPLLLAPLLAPPPPPPIYYGPPPFWGPRPFFPPGPFWGPGPFF